VRRQQQNADAKLGIATVATAEDAQRAFDALAPFEAGSMHRTVSRMYEPVNQVSLQPPFSIKPTEVQAIAATIAAELRAVREQAELAKRVLRQGVSKALQLFATKCSAAVTESAEALQAVDSATAAQLQNASLHNALLLLKDEATGVLAQHLAERGGPSLPEDAEALECANSLAAHASHILDRLVAGIQDHLEMLVAEMHDENFDKALPATSHLDATNSGVQCSSYIRRLEAAVHHARRRILAKFNGFDASAGVTLGRKVLGSFVRNVAFVSTASSDQGKMRLAQDMAQLELAISPLCSSQELASTVEYAALRNMRPLLFATTDEITRDASAAMPPSVIVHHLIARSGEIPLPHTVLEWTAAEYALWLREHKEREIWNSAVQPCLERYKNSRDLQGGALCALYCTIIEQGPQLLAQWERPGAHQKKS